MKHAIHLLILTLFLTLLTPLSAQEPDLLNVRATPDGCIPIVLDTDLGGDIDDAFALALIHRFADRGVCRLLGVTLTNSHPDAARYIAAENALYGRPEIPIGQPERAGRHTDNYPSATLKQEIAPGQPEYPVPDAFEPVEPVALLRKLLAESEDESVVMIQIGFSTNLANLLETGPDEYSALDGKALAKKKVRLLSVMGGAFTIDPTAEEYRDHAEWNIKNDVPAAQKLAREWPTPIVWSGYEVGVRIRMSPTNLKRDYRSARGRFLRDSYEHWANRGSKKEGLNHRRPTWDLTNVLFAVRPESGRGYFALSEPGRVEFDESGRTFFTPDPNGSSRVFLVDESARVRVAEAFVNLCSEP